MRPDTRSPVCAHRASPPPCRRFGTVLLATKRHPASAASAFTRMQPDTRPPVRTHRAPPPLCRRFGAPSPRGGLPPPKGSGSILPPAPDGRRCKAPFRATSSPGRPRTLGRSARPTRRKRPAFPGRRPDAADLEVRAVLHPPRRKRTGSDVPRPAPSEPGPHAGRRRHSSPDVRRTGRFGRSRAVLRRGLGPDVRRHRRKCLLDEKLPFAFVLPIADYP